MKVIRFMDNGSRYIRTHYAIAFIVNSIHVFSHLRLKSAIMYIIDDDIQRKNATYLPAQSPAHKINDKNIALN